MAVADGEVAVLVRDVPFGEPSIPKDCARDWETSQLRNSPLTHKGLVKIRVQLSIGMQDGPRSHRMTIHLGHKLIE